MNQEEYNEIIYMQKIGHIILFVKILIIVNIINFQIMNNEYKY